MGTGSRCLSNRKNPHAVKASMPSVLVTCCRVYGTKSTGFGRRSYNSPGKTPIKMQAAAASPIATSIFPGGSFPDIPRPFPKNM